MNIPNPFEVIYEFNARYNKYIAIFVVLALIVILPQTLQGFKNTESDQRAFLSSNSEGKIVNDLLKEKFPSREEASMTLVVHGENGFLLNSSNIDKFIFDLQDSLDSSPVLQSFNASTITLKSIERDAIKEYTLAMDNANKSLQDKFRTISINKTYSDVAQIEDFVNQTIDLANSIESFNTLTSLYMKYYYDVMRTVFYQYNQTNAFDPPFPFSSSDYSVLNSTLDSTLGVIDFNTSFAIYLGANQSGIHLANLLGLDTFSNQLARSFLNKTLELMHSSTNTSVPYSQSGLHYILQVIHDTWVSGQNNYTNAKGQLMDLLVGSPLKNDTNILSRQIMTGSQFLLLSSLNNINNIVLEASFLNLTKSSLAGNDVLSDMEDLFSGLSSGSNVNQLPAFPPMNSTLLKGISFNISDYGLKHSKQTSNSSFSVDNQLLQDIINIGVDQRITQDQNVIGNFTLNKALELFSNSSLSTTNDLFSFDSDVNGNINQTKVLEFFNLTRYITDSYIAGKSGKLNDSATLDKIAITSASEIISGVKTEFPAPSIASFPTSLRNAFISKDNTTMLVIVNYGINPRNKDQEEQVNEVRKLVSEVISSSKLKNSIVIYVSGEIAVNWDMDSSMESDISKIDLVTVILVLFLLTIVFRSFITPLVPLISIFMALLMAVGVLSVVSSIQDVKIPSLMIAVLSVIMFGAGVDYCLFVIARYREERLNGKPKRRAVKESVLHAGESVVSSGTTVMIGFGSLLLSSFGLLNQMGRGPLIGIAFSLLAALTLIPIALFIFGDKLFWWRNFEKEYETMKESSKQVPNTNLSNKRLRPNNSSAKSPLFRNLATFTVHNPWKVIIFFLVVSTPFFFFTFQIQPSYDNTDLLPTNVESVDGLNVLSESFPPGELFPLIILFDFDSSISNGTYFDLQSLDLIESFITSLDNFTTPSDNLPLFSEIRTFSRPNSEIVNYSNPDIINDAVLGSSMLSYVSTKTDNKTVIVKAFTHVDPIGEDSLPIIGQLKSYRDTLLSTNSSFSHVKIYFGGSPALFNEIQTTVGNESPLLAGFVLVGIYLVLFILLGSFWTPIRLELTILISLGITLGATQLFFVGFLGRGIPWILPIMLFVLIFGLGIDYDIFIVTRIREEIAHKGLDDDEAIINAIESTGSVISAAGIIMASALGSLMLASSNILQIMGFAFFVSILLDATIVRVFLVPALMVVMGKKYNWWNPIKRLERVPSQNEREAIRVYYNEHLVDEKKRVTDTQVEKKLIQLTQERRELYFYWRKFVNHAKRWRNYTRFDSQKVQDDYNHTKNLISKLSEEYATENPQMLYTLQGDFNRNLKLITKIENVLFLFEGHL